MLCFQLVSKETKKPSALSKIDEDICNLLGQKSNPIEFGLWYVVVGFQLACGCNFEEIRENLPERLSSKNNIRDMQRVIDYLEKNYTVEHWSE